MGVPAEHAHRDDDHHGDERPYGRNEFEAARHARQQHRIGGASEAEKCGIVVAKTITRGQFERRKLLGH